MRRYGFVRVDLDQINSERGIGNLSNDAISDADWKITYDESYKRTAHTLAHSKTVINDTANFTREQRDKLRAISLKYHVSTKVIYVNPPDDMVKKRWLDNRITKIRNDVRDEDFFEVADNFQIPSADEDIIYYDQTLPLDRWIPENIPI